MRYNVLVLKENPVSLEIKEREIKGLDRAIEFAKHFTEVSEEDGVCNSIAQAIVTIARMDDTDQFGNLHPRDISAIAAIAIGGETVYYNGKLDDDEN